MASNDTRVVQSEGSNAVMPATPTSTMPPGSAALGMTQACAEVSLSGAMQQPVGVSVAHVSGAPIAPVAPALAGLPGHGIPDPVGNQEATKQESISKGPPGHDTRP